MLTPEDDRFELHERLRRVVGCHADDQGFGMDPEVLTLDHRHCRVVTAPDGRPFRLLPADG